MHEGEVGMLSQMTKLKEDLGESTFFFSPFNPTGSYRLKLDHPI